MPPFGFSWVEPGRVAAHAAPSSPHELTWLRSNGIELLLTLTEESLPKRWVNDAGLMAVHVPVPDFQAPTDEQFDVAVETIFKGVKSGMGVAVHCLAGRGRTGTVLAAYFVASGESADDAIRKVRNLRPGSIETAGQERAIHAFARRRAEGVRGR
jgi:atypical dual specificity phosphatase